MTPKQKAEQLIALFEITAHPTIDMDNQISKTCALKCVNEMMEASAKLDWQRNIYYDPFLIEVKKELEGIIDGQNISKEISSILFMQPKFHPPTEG